MFFSLFFSSLFSPFWYSLLTASSPAHRLSVSTNTHTPSPSCVSVIYLQTGCIYGSVLRLLTDLLSLVPQQVQPFPTPVFFSVWIPWRLPFGSAGSAIFLFHVSHLTTIYFFKQNGILETIHYCFWNYKKFLTTTNFLIFCFTLLYTFNFCSTLTNVTLYHNS